jgi:trehalose 6-phosphate synthase/phosphatase
MEIKRLVIASNRLPVIIRPGGDGKFTVTRGLGGLVTAVGPVLRD